MANNKPHTTVFYILKDSNKEWRWHAKRVGRIVACSGEGYKSRAGCKKSMLKFISSIYERHYNLEGVAGL